MEVNQVRYFLSVSRHLNFTKAAQICNVSQPALTKAIQRLEENLGAPLFNRNTKSVDLTDFGKSMLTHLEQVERARLAAKREAAIITQNLSKTIHAGIMCTLGAERIRPVLAQFLEQNHNIEIVLHDIWAEKGRELLISGAIDCAFFGQHQLHDDKIDHHILYNEPMGLLTRKGHALSQKEKLHLVDLHNVDYADRLRCEFRNEFFELLADKQFHVNVKIRSEREDWIQDFVKKSDLVSIVPKGAVTGSDFSFTMIDDLPAFQNVCLATLKNRPISSHLTKLMNFVYDQQWESPPFESSPPQ